MDFDGIETGTHCRNVSEERRRLHIYRTALARLGTEQTSGIPPVRAAWNAACAINESFALDTRQCALLMQCLVTAACAARGES